MNRILIYIIFAVLPYCVACNHDQQKETLPQPKKTYDQIFKERDEQKRINLHNAMPHLIQIAEKRNDVGDYSRLFDFWKSFNDFAVLQNNYFEQLDEAIVDADSIELLRNLIIERMKIEYPALRKQICRVLIHNVIDQKNNSLLPLSNVQCKGNAYDTLELASVDFYKSSKRKSVEIILLPFRFRQIIFRMKKDFNDFDIFENHLSDTTLAPNQPYVEPNRMRR